MLLGGLGCEEAPANSTSDQAPRPLTDKPPPEAPAVSMSTANIHTRLDMLGRHARTIEARDALVNGDLESARQAMLDLSRATNAKVGPALEAHITKVSEHAQAAAQAKTPGQASSALGRVAGACAACHKEAKRGPAFPPAGAPEDLPDPKVHMWRHQWAVDRLWEGLSGPYDEAWKVGAAQLSEPALKPVAFGVDASDWKHYGKLARRIHELGGEAEKAQTPTERAEVFGSLLSTCGECHSALGKGHSPKPFMPQQTPDKPGSLPPPKSVTL